MLKMKKINFNTAIFALLLISIFLTGCGQNSQKRRDAEQNDPIANFQTNDTEKTTTMPKLITNIDQLKTMPLEKDERAALDAIIEAPDFEQLLLDGNVDVSKVKFERIKKNETSMVYKGEKEEVSLTPNDWIVSIGETSEHDFIYAYIQNETYEFLGYGMIK